jgi:hypothetical protein
LGTRTLSVVPRIRSVSRYCTGGEDLSPSVEPERPHETFALHLIEIAQRYSPIRADFLGQLEVANARDPERTGYSRRVGSLLHDNSKSAIGLQLCPPLLPHERVICKILLTF